MIDRYSTAIFNGDQIVVKFIDNIYFDTQFNFNTVALVFHTGAL